MGAIPITLTLIGSDDAVGWGAPSIGGEINIVAAGGSTTIFGLLRAEVAYAPISAEVITVNLEVHQN